MGDLTGNYIWLLFPLYNSGSNKLLNAVALESFSTSTNDEQKPEAQIEKNDEAKASTQEDTEEKSSNAGGKATYFFMLLNRQAYTQAQRRRAENRA